MNSVKAITFGAGLYTHLPHVFCLVHHQSKRKVKLELSRNQYPGTLYSRKYGRSMTYEKVGVQYELQSIIVECYSKFFSA